VYHPFALRKKLPGCRFDYLISRRTCCSRFAAEPVQRSNELDRAKMQLAIMLEQANQIVKAKQFIGEQVEEIRQEVAKEREVRNAGATRLSLCAEGTVDHPHHARVLPRHHGVRATCNHAPRLNVLPIRLSPAGVAGAA